MLLSGRFCYLSWGRDVDEGGVLVVVVRLRLVTLGGEGLGGVGHPRARQRGQGARQGQQVIRGLSFLLGPELEGAMV